MPTAEVEIQTPRGPSKTVVCTPDGGGPWPAVIFFVDGGGLRPSMREMGERIAKMGYLVAIPDLFHGAGSPLDLLPPGCPREMKHIGKLFEDEGLRAAFMTRFYGPALAYDNLKSDIGALLDWLGKRSDVSGRVGTTGYCMGGNASLRTATIFGDRIAAAASFHGGGLVTPTPDSPHTRVGSIRARVYVAGAIEDQSFPEEAKKTLTEALEAAHVKFEMETYQALHGFAVPDHSTFDPAAAERHYEALEKLLGATLR